jgi:tRNA pseudouridine55 synthase
MTTTEAPLDGVLPLDKPAGPSSHDMVAAARRALHTRRIGHTGTLDPFASGLLLLCIGNATRAAEYLSRLDKRYLARIRLGAATDTDDRTGTIIAEHDAFDVDLAAVEHALGPLRGNVMQRPPAYSAKKRGGERAYTAARAGRALELDPVRVHIHEITILAFQPPLLDLEIVCGSGTYIRAIARDLGETLGVGGHLAALRRTAVGTHAVESACSVDDLADPERVRHALVPTVRALSHLPRIDLTAEQREHVRHGRVLHLPDAPQATIIVLTDAEERLVAIAESGAGLVRPRKVFP